MADQRDRHVARDLGWSPLRRFWRARAFGVDCEAGLQIRDLDDSGGTPAPSQRRPSGPSPAGDGRALPEEKGEDDG
jgi:hypothetical protein